MAVCKIVLADIPVLFVVCLDMIKDDVFLAINLFEWPLLLPFAKTASVLHVFATSLIPEGTTEFIG